MKASIELAYLSRMIQPRAYCVNQEFAPAPPGQFQVDRHYLLYASKGAMRLDADGKTWALPPARAAIIEANKAITVTLPQQMTICSALFAPEFAPKPPASLTVIDMTPLARELVLSCAEYGPESGDVDEHALALFRALVQVTWRLAEHPSKATMPSPKSAKMRAALSATEAAMGSDISFDQVAQDVAITPRSLARRFAEELGMTWRQALRRMRMIRAIEFLAENDRSVTDIAFATGYNSLSAFNAAFKEFTGLTPTEYRKSFRP